MGWPSSAAGLLPNQKPDFLKIHYSHSRFHSNFSVSYSAIRKIKSPSKIASLSFTKLNTPQKNPFNVEIISYPRFLLIQHGPWHHIIHAVHASRLAFRTNDRDESYFWRWRVVRANHISRWRTIVKTPCWTYGQGMPET